MTDGMTVTSLSASLLQKINSAMDHLCQVMLNQTLSREFSSYIIAKSHKKKSCKMRPVCNQQQRTPLASNQYYFTICRS